jgi:hypothetical protein
MLNSRNIVEKAHENARVEVYDFLRLPFTK